VVGYHEDQNALLVYGIHNTPAILATIDEI
jgi:hypothetical protein